MKFERFINRAKKHCFRIRASNGQIVAQSEGYSRRTDCTKTINSIRAQAFGAEVVDVASPPAVNRKSKPGVSKPRKR